MFGRFLAKHYAENLQTMNKVTVEERLAQSERTLKASRGKGMDLSFILTLSAFAAIIIFIIVMILI